MRRSEGLTVFLDPGHDVDVCEVLQPVAGADGLMWDVQLTVPCTGEGMNRMLQNVITSHVSVITSPKPGTSNTRNAEGPIIRQQLHRS